MRETTQVSLLYAHIIDSKVQHDLLTIQNRALKCGMQKQLHHKDAFIGFRGTPRDVTVVKERASKTGLTVSAYCRIMTTERTPSVTIQSHIAQTQWERLSRMGSNINHIAHALNSGQLIPCGNIEVLLSEVRNELNLTREALISGQKESA